MSHNWNSYKNDDYPLYSWSGYLDYQRFSNKIKGKIIEQLKQKRKVEGQFFYELLYINLLWQWWGEIKDCIYEWILTAVPCIYKLSCPPKSLNPAGSFTMYRCTSLC